jgi:hypothetical protein
MVELLRHRQTKEAATAMFYLTPTAPHLDSTHLLEGVEPETGQEKTPDLAAGFCRSGRSEKFIARVDPKPPEGRLFSTALPCTNL